MLLKTKKIYSINECKEKFTVAYNLLSHLCKDSYNLWAWDSKKQISRMIPLMSVRENLLLLIICFFVIRWILNVVHYIILSFTYRGGVERREVKRSAEMWNVDINYCMSQDYCTTFEQIFHVRYLQFAATIFWWISICISIVSSV